MFERQKHHKQTQKQMTKWNKMFAVYITDTIPPDK